MTPDPSDPGAFLAAVVRVLSHDAQTPLTSVIGFAHTLERADLPEAVRAPALTAVVRNARRLSLMLRNLVDAARIEAGELTLHLADVDLDDAVARAVARADELALERPFVVEGVAGRRVRADGERLVTVLLDVLHNAGAHSPPGRPVVVRVRDATVEVEDEGPGFSPDALAHGCEPFWRGAEARGGGAGVGLFVACRLAEAMGGALVLARAEGGGALVRLTLPPAG